MEYSPHLCDTFNEMVEFGGTIEDFIAMLEIDHNIFNNWRTQYPNFDQTVSKALSDCSASKSIAVQKPVKQISARKKKKQAIKKARVFTNSVTLATLTMRDIIDPDAYKTGSLENSPDIIVLHQEIQQQIAAISDGDTSSTETSLAAQAKTLDLIFNDMIMTSIRTDNMESKRAYMDMAFRAQNQARKTLLAMNAIKNPPPKQIVEQQNIALNQQINHGILDKVTPISKCQKIKPENELISEVKHETLDKRRTVEAVTID